LAVVVLLTLTATIQYLATSHQPQVVKAAQITQLGLMVVLVVVVQELAQALMRAATATRHQLTQAKVVMEALAPILAQITDLVGVAAQVQLALPEQVQ
jgi:hypothetical protein